MSLREKYSFSGKTSRSLLYAEGATLALTAVGLYLGAFLVSRLHHRDRRYEEVRRLFHLAFSYLLIPAA